MDVEEAWKEGAGRKPVKAFLVCAKIRKGSRSVALLAGEDDIKRALLKAAADPMFNDSHGLCVYKATEKRPIISWTSTGILRKFVRLLKREEELLAAGWGVGINGDIPAKHMMRAVDKMQRYYQLPFRCVIASNHGPRGGVGRDMLVTAPGRSK